MKSLKVKKASFDNRKHLVCIETVQGVLSLPYAKLSARPTKENPITKIFADKELGNLAVSYILKDGTEDSIPVDAFLDHNADPDYIRHIELHKLTNEAITALERSGLSKREVCRRLGTSMSQLQRLFDPANSQKTIDQMIRLLTVLGTKVEIRVAS
jgi:predicted XRE-type DNA-binding protein